MDLSRQMSEIIERTIRCRREYRRATHSRRDVHTYVLYALSESVESISDLNEIPLASSLDLMRRQHGKPQESPHN